MKTAAKTTTRSTQQVPDDFFGGCPHCGGNDGYVNLRRTHVFLCEKHKTAWVRGDNLFSSWRQETPADWKRNRRMLTRGRYRLVEPIFSLDTKKERSSKQ